MRVFLFLSSLACLCALIVTLACEVIQTIH